MNDDASHRLVTHEAVCAERYSGIMSRLARLETILIAVAGTLLCGMAALILAMIRDWP